MKYTLLNPLTGAAALVDASGLTRELQVNRILLLSGEHVGIITHRDLISFCRWCAGVAIARCKTVPPEAHAALALVDKWLVDPKSVSNEELSQAADAAYTAAAEAVAAWADATAARAAEAAGVVADAIWAADADAAAADAADAVWASARSAARADVSFEAQAQWLVDHLRSAQ